MTDPVKEVKDSLEAKLKEGFNGLQLKYDAVAEELQKGNTVTGTMKAQIETQKGEIERARETIRQLKSRQGELSKFDQEELSRLSEAASANRAR